MQKRYYLVVAVVVVALVLGGTLWGLSILNPSTAGASGRLNVVATFYPLYDFAQNVGGNKTSVSILVPETEDVHDFTPVPSSVEEVASANVLIFNGAGLEPWISSLVSSAANPKLVLVNCSQGIQLIPVPPEFQRNGQVVDPHIWLDPVLAKQMVNNILQGLIKADPEDNRTFTTNAQAYEAKLDYLNSEIMNETNFKVVKTQKFITFHEAFHYFANQYNLTQIAILGPFEESPTGTDIQNVIGNVTQNHLAYIGYESLENNDIAKMVSSETNATLILMDPIEGLSQAQQMAGMNYLSLMQMDLANIVLALTHVAGS
jgi:zinc transport system substrate-binding protein